MRKVCCRHCTPPMFLLTKPERDQVTTIESQTKKEDKEARRKLFLTTNPRLVTMTFLQNLCDSLTVIVNNKVHINSRPIIPLTTMKMTKTMMTPHKNYKILQAQPELKTKRTNTLTRMLILWRAIQELQI